MGRLKRAVLIAVFATSLGAGLIVLVQPGLIPASVTERVMSITEVFSLTVLGIAAAIIIFLSLLYRLFTGSAAGFDRSLITDSVPETVPDGKPISPAVTTTNAYRDAIRVFNETGRDERRLAMYGVRAGSTDATELPENVETLFDELRVTARDVYAVANQCDEETANEAVLNGSWAENRRAAAFLRETGRGDAEFTVWERVKAWFVPEYVFKQYVEETVREIERVTEGYTINRVRTDGSGGEVRGE